MFKVLNYFLMSCQVRSCTEIVAILSYGLRRVLRPRNTLPEAIHSISRHLFRTRLGFDLFLGRLVVHQSIRSTSPSREARLELQRRLELRREARLAEPPG